MAIVVADLSADLLMDILLNAAAGPASWGYHLYVSNTTPTPASTIGDFTEATETGYTPNSVPNSGWTHTTSPSGTTKSVNTTFLWTITEAGTFYGYYVTTPGGALLWSERFAAPIVFGALGGSIEIEPTLTLVSPIT